jgi:hypothetical protein
MKLEKLNEVIMNHEGKPLPYTEKEPTITLGKMLAHVCEETRIFQNNNRESIFSHRLAVKLFNNQGPELELTPYEGKLLKQVVELTPHFPAFKSAMLNAVGYKPEEPSE